jgi:hypothetical protein
MTSRSNDSAASIDPVTCRSIREAVGERLQRDLRLDTLEPSRRLDDLMDELRRRDEIDGR